MPNLIRLLMLGLCACPLLAQSPSASFALRGTLVTPGGIVENGTVLIQQNKITAVGTKVKLPANSTVIDTVE